ncbi:MAG: alpha-L-fucosidase [Bacteroides sp.]|nr:alpha-L-fucosidase [Bacteroides sp.]
MLLTTITERSHGEKEVSLSTKHDAYLYGTIKDYERQGRAPKEKTDYYWQVDEPIGNKFGYIEGLKLQSSASVIRKLVENISKNGNLCLNISPKADGTIPEDQQEVLRQVGRWLKVNGEDVYGTRAWMVYGEGPGIDLNRSEVDIRFTQKGDHEVYAFVIRYAENKLLIRSFTNTNLGGGK